MTHRLSNDGRRGPDPILRHDLDGQLRLALTELGRLEREIEELTPRVKDAADRALLMSLRACRETLLRMAHVRLAGVRSYSA